MPEENPHHLYVVPSRRLRKKTVSKTVALFPAYIVQKRVVKSAIYVSTFLAPRFQRGGVAASYHVVRGLYPRSRRFAFERARERRLEGRDCIHGVTSHTDGLVPARGSFGEKLGAVVQLQPRASSAFPTSQFGWSLGIGDDKPHLILRVRRHIAQPAPRLGFKRSMQGARKAGVRGWTNQRAGFGFEAGYRETCS